MTSRNLLTEEEAESLRAALESEVPEDIVDWHERTGHEGQTILELYDALQAERLRWSKLVDHLKWVRSQCLDYTPIDAGGAGVAMHVIKKMQELEEE